MCYFTKYHRVVWYTGSYQGFEGTCFLRLRGIWKIQYLSSKLHSNTTKTGATCIATELRGSEFQNWENLWTENCSILVPEFGPKKSRPPIYNFLLHFMSYVQLIVKQMKCTLTRRGTTRISADTLFFMLQWDVQILWHKLVFVKEGKANVSLTSRSSGNNSSGLTY